MTDKIKIALSKPVNMPVDGDMQEVSELEFNEPTGKDIRDCGVPIKVHSDGGFEFISESMAKVLSRLSGKPEPFIGMLSASDWMTCAMAVMPFFTGTSEKD